MIQRALGMFRRDPQLAVVLFVGVVIAYLSLSPTLMLFYGSFRERPLGVPSDFSLGHYIHAYTDPLTYELLLNSFLFASGSSLLATFLAATLAWISIRTNAPGRRLFELTSRHAGGFLDDPAEPAHRIDQPHSDGVLRSVGGAV